MVPELPGQFGDSYTLNGLKWITEAFFTNMD